MKNQFSLSISFNVEKKGNISHFEFFSSSSFFSYFMKEDELQCNTKTNLVNNQFPSIVVHKYIDLFQWRMSHDENNQVNSVMIQNQVQNNRLLSILYCKGKDHWNRLHVQCNQDPDSQLKKKIENWNLVFHQNWFENFIHFFFCPNLTLKRNHFWNFYRNKFLFPLLFVSFYHFWFLGFNICL